MTQTVKDEELAQAIEEDKEESLEIAKSTMVGDLMCLLTDQLEAVPKNWKDLSENEQTVFIHTAKGSCERIVNKAVDIIASEGRVSLRATLDGITVKNGLAVKLAVPKGDPNTLKLVDTVGEVVKIIILDEKKYTDNLDTSPEPMKDQGDLVDDKKEIDTLFNSAVDFVLEKGAVSISGVQRKLRIGYNRAARMIEDMERQGIVSEMESNGTRKILIDSEGWESKQENAEEVQEAIAQAIENEDGAGEE